MDGMTIDEIIKYFDDDAKENAKLAIIYRGNDDDLAEMHKQDSNRSAYVSVWLRELIHLKNITEYLRDMVTCFEFMDSMHYNEDIIEWAESELRVVKEVNADD